MTPDDARAWSRMLHMVPPSVRADADLHRAWIVREAQRRGLTRAQARRTFPEAERTLAEGFSGAGVFPWIVGGVVVLGVGFAVGWWLLKKRKERVGYSGGLYEALAQV